MDGFITKNYNTDGGNRMVIGGILEFTEGAEIKGFPGAENMTPKTTNTAAEIRGDLNTLIMNLKNAGIMIPDSWNVSVLLCPTPASMQTPETAANSGHATVSIEGNAITIALDCKISELEDTDRGGTWGEHKWLGFGIRTGLNSIVDVQFTDDTGVSTTLSSIDADEATALGLSSGDFVLYIEAEQPEYLTGEKQFTLWADGHAKTTFTMQITEPKD